MREGAAVIQSHSGEALTKLFPEHSIEGPSEAKPEIWTDWEEFSELAKQLDVFAAGLAEQALTALSVFAADMSVGRRCVSQVAILTHR